MEIELFLFSVQRFFLTLNWNEFIVRLQPFKYALMSILFLVWFYYRLLGF